MNRTTTVYGLSAVVVIGAVGAWLTTGREGYTRWPDAKLAQSDAPASEIEEDLFADIGFETDDDIDAQGATPDIESRFAFGLAPGGFGPKHLPSIATAVALAVGASSVAASASLRWKRKQQPDSPPQP